MGYDAQRPTSFDDAQQVANLTSHRTATNGAPPIITSINDGYTWGALGIGQSDAQAGVRTLRILRSGAYMGGLSENPGGRFHREIYVSGQSSTESRRIVGTW